MTEQYVVEIVVEDGEWPATEFAHHHANELHDMGYEAVFSERTSRVALLREVEDDE